jgi:hypothetical protein
MTLDKLLTEFYIANGIPENGGIEEDTKKSVVSDKNNKR